jgi:alkyl hydroperoxide reductase subunit AhpF
MNSEMSMKALGPLRRFAEELQDEKVMDDPTTFINGCLHKESRLTILETGHAELERLEYINLQRVELFLSKDLSKCIQGSKRDESLGHVPAP